MAKCGYDMNTEQMKPISDCCPSCMETHSDNKPISISIVNSADTNSKNQNSPQYQQRPQYSQPPQYPQQGMVQQTVAQPRPVFVRRTRPVINVQPTRIVQMTRVVERRVPVTIVKEVTKEVEKPVQVIREVPVNPCKPRNYAQWY